MHSNETVIAVSVAGAALFVATVVSISKWKPIVITLGRPTPKSPPPPRVEEQPATPELSEAPVPGIVPLPDELVPVEQPARRYFGGASPTYLGLLR